MLRRRSPTLARNSSSARSPASSAVRIRARSRSSQSLRRRGCGSVLRVARSAATESVGSAFGSVFASLGRPTKASGWPQSAPRCIGKCTARSRSTSTVESSRLHAFRRTARKLSSKCTTVGFIKVRPQQWGTESVGSVIRRIGCENRYPCETEKHSAVTKYFGAVSITYHWISVISSWVEFLAAAVGGGRNRHLL